MKPGPSVVPKKPYKSPQLLVYGSLSELTLAKSNKGAKDGGPVVGMRRTR